MSLIAEGVEKSFDGNTVLHQVSLQVQPGQIVALMGPSSTGKTTLLRCLCGLELAQKGRIAIDDTVLCDRGRWVSPAAYRQKIGLVFQNWNLFPHWTVLRNLTEAPVRLRRMSREEAEKKAGLLLSRLHIEEKSGAYPRTLSGGQQQRVAIARACMLSPAILCFDEPTSALDEQSAQEVSRIIRLLAKQESMGILIVTHDEAFAAQTGTDLVTLQQLQSSSSQR